jgi:hypothetical protein
MFDQEYDFTFPNRRLMKFCESHGLTCYDSLPFFLETAKTLKLKPPFFAWKYDGHYAQIGHTTMGEYLNSRLRSLPHFAAAK